MGLKIRPNPCQSCPSGPSLLPSGHPLGSLGTPAARGRVERDDREGWEGTRLQKASSVGSSVARYLRFLAHSTSLRSVSHHFTPSPLPLRGGRSPGEGVVRDRRERAASGVSSDVTEGLSPFRSLRRLFPLASYPPLRSGSERNEESGEPVGGGER